MKLSVLELLRENGMPGINKEAEEEDLFASEQDEEEKEGDEEKPVPPTPINGPNLKPKKKKPANYLA